MKRTRKNRKNKVTYKKILKKRKKKGEKKKKKKKTGLVLCAILVFEYKYKRCAE
jgi:hypothetical protein